MKVTLTERKKPPREVRSTEFNYLVHREKATPLECSTTYPLSDQKLPLDKSMCQFTGNPSLSFISLQYHFLETFGNFWIMRKLKLNKKLK